MPDNTYPPAANDTGAITVPRQLDRWIDVNPQGGALGRAMTYITLPAFSAIGSWGGESDIVASFNCESPNNFSIKPGFVVPVNPNYVLCISYRVGATITRYLLWDAAGSALNMAVPSYAGQPILKNFRFEIWNTSQGACSSGSAVQFYTSVRQNIDYRFANDGALVDNDGEQTLFADSQNVAPAIPAGQLLLQFIGSYGVAGGVWGALVDNVRNPAWHFTNATTTGADGTLANGVYLTGLGANTVYLSGNTVMSGSNSLTLLAVIRSNDFTDGNSVCSIEYNTIPLHINYMIQTTGDAGAGEPSGNYACANFGDSGSRGTGVSAYTGNAGEWAIIVLNVDIVGGAVASWATKLNGVPTPAVFPGFDSLLVQAISGAMNTIRIPGSVNPANIDVAEVLLYNNQGNLQPIINYLWTKYQHLFSLPLNFPVGSVSKTN